MSDRRRYRTYYTFITNTMLAGALSNKTPSKNAKIPDVAKVFNVKTEPTF